MSFRAKVEEIDWRKLIDVDFLYSLDVYENGKTKHLHIQLD